jgi:predicted phage terminase large subunit-like protein
MPNFLSPFHIMKMVDALQRVADGTLKRLIINIPRRHGKTETTCKLFPAYFLGMHPTRHVILGAFGEDLVNKASRRLRRRIRSKRYMEFFPGVELAKDARAVEEWELAGFEGGFKGVSVGSGVVGYGADLMIIDDPHKGRKEADSQVERDAVGNWFESEMFPCLEPNPLEAAIVVIHTRWHEDDLTGRLLEKMRSDPLADQYETIQLSALSGPAEDIPLWPERFPKEAYYSIRANMTAREWQSQYQCNPVPPDGTLFKKKDFVFSPSAPQDLQWIRVWDLATSSLQTADRTVGALMAVDSQKNYWIRDIVFGRFEWPAARRKILDVAYIDGSDVMVYIEKGAFNMGRLAKDLVDTWERIDIPVRAIAPDKGDKYQRAQPLAARAEAGKVIFVTGGGATPHWANTAIEELVVFPHGKNDDFVDALTLGAYILATENIGPAQSSINPPMYSSLWVQREAEKVRSQERAIFSSDTEYIFSDFAFADN